MRQSRPSMKAEISVQLESYIDKRLSNRFSSRVLSLQNACVELYDAFEVDDPLPYRSMNNHSTAITIAAKPPRDSSKFDSKLIFRNQSYYLQDNLNNSILELSNIRSRKRIKQIRSKKSPYAAANKSVCKRPRSSNRSSKHFGSRINLKSLSPTKK